MGVKFYLHYWPILTAVWFLLTFLTSYLVAVFNKHVYAFFPFISDTGTTPPESCIFGQMLNIGAVLLLVMMYIRFRTVELISHRGFSKNYNMWNKFSNIFGSLSCLGMSLVANFQETSEINVHGVGAFLAFVVGWVYCIIQTYLTWLSYSSKLLKCLRILLCLLFIPMYIASSVCGSLAFEKFKGKNLFKWGDKEGGYELHLVATFTEWIMAIIIILYLATYYTEFKLIQFKEISFVLKDE